MGLIRIKSTFLGGRGGLFSALRRLVYDVDERIFVAPRRIQSGLPLVGGQSREPPVRAGSQAICDTKGSLNEMLGCRVWADLPGGLSKELEPAIEMLIF